MIEEGGGHHRLAGGGELGRRLVGEGEVLASSGDERGGGFEWRRFDGKVRRAPRMG